MAECLKIYNYVTGVDDPYFHDADNPILITSFTYTANRMGGVQLTASFYHKDHLDDYWNGKQYVIFRGEKYFVKQVPSSTKDNSSDRYKYDVTFKSERSMLDDVYFFDVVTDETENDRYQSNNTNVVFFGDIHEFAKRLNYSLQYSGLDYTVVVDDDVTSESKYVQFEDKFISDALQEIYNTYNIPYYFDGKTIHIGYTNNAIAIPFAYGANRELLSVAKTNASYRIVNRCTGVGSSDNIPFYYPNETEKGPLEVVCPVSNSGVSSKDVHIENGSLLASKMEFSDQLIFSKLSSESTLDDPTITYLATGDTFANGGAVDIDIELGGNTWNVNAKSLKVEVPVSVPDGGSVEINLSTKYKFPNVSATSGEYAGSRMQLTPKETVFYRKQGASSWDAADKTITVQDTGVYEIQIQYSFSGIDSSVYPSIVLVTYFYASIDINTKNLYNAWTINGEKEVSLVSYGLNIEDGASPQVGDIIGIGVSGDFIRTAGKLMPSIYRETNGAERFYNALNNTYPDGDGGYLHFDNEYTETDPKEQIVEFSDIKPTIAGITNASGVRIDQIDDIAFDDDDSDEVDEDGEYLHPYFYVKLNKFDGDWGFNLFNMAIVGNTNMTLSLTSGNCSAANFEIAVVETDDGRFLNPVQVDDNGDIVPGGLDDKVNTTNIQDRQQDTSANSVWIALRKDDSTFGVVIPNATNNYKPSAGDSFVLLYIDLPEAYKRAAEKRLDDAILKYMLENNNSKFNFSIKFSRIFFAENPEILAQVNENARIILEYDDKEYTLYISTYTYTVKSDEDLPEISVDLKDTITVVQGAIEQMVNSVVGDTVAGMGLGETKDTLAANTRYFLRKDVEDTARKRITFLNGATFGNFADMIGGATMDIDPVTGQSTLTVDKLKVRLKAYFDQLTIVRTNSIGGKHIITPAGSIVCTRVEDTDDGTAYRCYFSNDQDGVNVANMFMAGDLAISESFNVMSGISDSGVTNNYYWREVVGVGPDYVELSKTKCDADSDIPKEGDVICQLGNISDVSRQGAIVLSSAGDDSPSVTLYSGINTYSYAGKDYIRFGINNSTNDPFMAVYGSMFFGDRDLTDPDATYITFQQKEGDDRKRLYIKADVMFGAGSTGLSNLTEWKNLSAQVSTIQDNADKWASDKYISPPEKDSLKRMMSEIRAERTTISANALKYGIDFSSYMTAFTLANNALIKYTASSPELIPIESDYDNIAAYYTARESILQQINTAENDAISDMDYLKKVFPNNVVDNNGVFLSRLMAVKNSTSADAVVVAGLYGGGVDSLNADGFEDPDHGILMMFAGADNIQSAKSANTRIYEDGYLITNNIEANGGKFGIFEIGANQWDESAIKYSMTDRSGYTYYGNITPEVFALGSYYNDLSQKEYVTICPNMNPDRYDYPALLTLQSYGTNRPLLCLDKVGGEEVLRIESGTVSGLRPETRKITSNTTLSQYDHTIISYGNGTSATVITLPSKPANGQRYEIFKDGNKPMTINGNGNIILRANGSSSASVTYQENTLYAMLTYSSEVGQWYMNVGEYK